MKSTIVPKNTVLRPTSKKTELKTPIKMSKVASKRLAANHNETLLVR